MVFDTALDLVRTWPRVGTGESWLSHALLAFSPALGFFLAPGWAPASPPARNDEFDIAATLYAVYSSPAFQQITRYNRVSLLTPSG
jgi:hypothetical protein